MAASAYSHLGSSGQVLPVEAFKIVHRYADKALELDSSIAESHIAKAGAYLLYEWKWKEAYDELQQAIALNPAAIEAYDLLGMYYIVVGQKDLAVQVLEEAEQIDPLSPAIVLGLGGMYIFAKRYDDAIKQAEKMLELHSRMRPAIELKAWATGMQGDWQAALVLFEEIYRLTNHPLKGLMGLAFAYGKLGFRDKVLECIAKMEQRQREEPNSVIDADLAGAWFGLGDLDKTFYYIDQCVEKKMGPVSYFLEYPAYEAIKNDPRYEALKNKMRLQFT